MSSVEKGRSRNVSYYYYYYYYYYYWLGWHRNILQSQMNLPKTDEEPQLRTEFVFSIKEKSTFRRRMSLRRDSWELTSPIVSGFVYLFVYYVSSAILCSNMGVIWLVEGLEAKKQYSLSVRSWSWHVAGYRQAVTVRTTPWLKPLFQGFPQITPAELPQARKLRPLAPQPPPPRHLPLPSPTPRGRSRKVYTRFLFYRRVGLFVSLLNV